MARASWTAFHNALTTVWAHGSKLANESADRATAIAFWRIVLGDDYFPLEPTT